MIVRAEGDQTDPSIEGQHVVFASNGAGTWDVLLYDLDVGQLAGEVASGPGDQDQPDVFGGTVAYRGPQGIFIVRDGRPEPVRAPGVQPALGACDPGAPVSEPTISAEVAAWVCGSPGGREIAVARHATAYEEYLLVREGAARDGDRFAPVAHGRLVAFVDGSDHGSVWLHDSGTKGTAFVCDGSATGVAVGDLGGPVVAVTRVAQGTDEDVEVFEASGRVTTLRVPGEQRNPHVSGDWVAFEDLSTGRSQVVLWQWATGFVFIPHPSASNQTLNDLEALPGTRVRAVFADDGDGTGVNRDIALYELAFQDGRIPDDGTGDVWPWPDPPPQGERPPPASCDDPDAEVIGTLVLGRSPGRPLAASVKVGAPPFPGDAVLPLLVCIDAERVSAGWVALDDEAMASPGDFSPGVTRLSLQGVAEKGMARIAGVIAGPPGASLVARVVADRGRAPPEGDAGARPLPTAATRGGCGYAGGLGSLAGLAVLLLARARRRR